MFGSALIVFSTGIHAVVSGKFATHSDYKMAVVKAIKEGIAARQGVDEVIDFFCAWGRNERQRLTPNEVAEIFGK